MPRTTHGRISPLLFYFSLAPFEKYNGGDGGRAVLPTGEFCVALSGWLWPSAHAPSVAPFLLLFTPFFLSLVLVLLLR